MEDKILATVAGKEIKESDLQNVISRYPEDRKSVLCNRGSKKAIIRAISII